MSNTQMAEITELAKGLAKSAQQSDSGGGSFMKFTKFGEWTWGTEAQEVEDNSLWAVHPQGFQHGWIAWGDKAHQNNGTKLGETMVAATEPLPFEKDLPEVQGSWAQQISMQMVCLNGMDKGTKVLFNSCSMGGRKVYHDVVNNVVAQITSGRQDIAPVVELSNSSYTHKEHGKIFTPVVKVESHKTLVELEAMLNSIEEEEDDAVDTAAALSQVDEPEDESKEDMKARIKAEMKAELAAEDKAASETVDDKADGEAAALAKTAAKAEAKAEAKAKAKAEAKAELKAELAAEAKAEAAAEIAAEAKATAGTDSKANTVAELDKESEKARAAAQAKGEEAAEKDTGEGAPKRRRRRS